MQSQSNQDYSKLMEFEVPRFRWVRGRACQILMEPPLEESPGLAALEVKHLPGTRSLLRQFTLEEDHGVLVCEGDGQKYEPLTEAPEAYLKFAAVQSRSTNQDERERATIEFAKRYGLPRDAEPLIADGGRGLPLDIFLVDAEMVNLAVRYLAAATKAERGGDYVTLQALASDAQMDMDTSVLGVEGTLLLHAKLLVTQLLNIHLPGVALAPMVDAGAVLDVAQQVKGKSRSSGGKPSIRILPQYTCDSLLTAMWLQIYFASTERRIVRSNCKGCGRPFEAKDRRQQYCDPYCRRATNQRNYYGREKRKQKEAQNG